MSIFASIGARLALASRRLRSWSWPSRLGVAGGFVVGGLLVGEHWSAAILLGGACAALMVWGDGIERRRPGRD